MKYLLLFFAIFAVLAFASCGTPRVGVSVGAKPYYGSRPYYTPRPYYNPYFYRHSNSWGRPHHRSYYPHN